MRIVFMGSPVFAVPTLRKLVREGYNIASVYTQPDRPAGRGREIAQPPVKKAALELGLEVRQPENLRSDDAQEELRKLKPDVIIVCAYGQILSQAVLDIPPCQCINVHFSLLPRHRGASPVAAAILDGDTYTGVSIQLVRKKLDTGPLLAGAAIPIQERETTGTLTEKLAYVGASLLTEVLEGWLRNERKPIEQDDSRSSYFSQITKESGRIDWSLPAESIRRQVQAYQPWPGSYTTWNGRKLDILEAAAVGEEEGTPGKVCQEYKYSLGIQTGRGKLMVKKLRLAGKRPLSAEEFIHGNNDIIGAVLGG